MPLQASSSTAGAKTSSSATERAKRRTNPSSRGCPHCQAVNLLGAGAGGGYPLFLSETPILAGRVPAGLADYVSESGNPGAPTVEFGLNKVGLVLTVL